MRLYKGWLGLVVGALFNIATPQTPLPITRVVLFRSGVGYIERFGQVNGEATLILSMREAQMNDLLKSLVLVDFDGGQILPVQYTPRDPLSRTLSAFAINIADNPNMQTLLVRLRGAPIEVQTARETVQGTVLSIETRKVPAGEAVVEQAFVNLMTREGMRSVPLDEVRHLRLRDERLQKELQEALAALGTGLDNTRKAVELRLRGQGTRRVLVGYLTEMPLWKMTYRLVIGAGEPLLQGWAIVENTTDEDWRNVRVELVSGRPVSYVLNLYEPIYVQRPRMQLQAEAPLAPETPELAMKAPAADTPFEAPPEPEAPAAVTDGRALTRRMMRGLGEAETALRESILEMARGQERGALFDYRIEQPVTILRQQSAMLPVLSRPIQAETVSLYNPANHPMHPFFGIKLTNTTELTLMEGPVTVYLDGSYGGDAQLRTLEPKAEQVLTFALDLGVEVAVDRQRETTQQVSLKIVRGVLEQETRLRRESEYRIQNRDSKPRTLLIEQPLDAAWQLVEPQPAERTATYYRFRLVLPPQQNQTLTVVEQRTLQRTYALLTADLNILRVFTNDTRVSEPIRRAITEILNRRRAIDNLDSAIRAQEAKIKAITDDQARIRENMKAIDRTSELYRQYLQKLAQQEREIEQARAEIQRLNAQKARAQRALEEYLANLNL